MIVEKIINVGIGIHAGQGIETLKRKLTNVVICAVISETAFISSSWADVVKR